MQDIIAECRKRISSPYRLSILASKRARQLQMGAPPLEECKFKNYTNVALLEISTGKVTHENILELEKQIDLRKVDTKLITFGKIGEQISNMVEEEEIAAEELREVPLDQI